MNSTSLATQVPVNSLGIHPGAEVVESTLGMYFYHLRRAGALAGPAFCGARVMGTHIQLKAWGLRSHLRERYCVACLCLARADRLFTRVGEAV